MEIYDVAIVPLIVGLVELLKQIGLPTEFAALASAIIGILIGVFYIAPDNIPKGIIVGLSLGLTASGLYSGIRNTVCGAKAAIKAFKEHKASKK